MPPEALVVSQVFVGKPSLLGEQRGKPVMSGIRKHPATSETLALGRTGLEGDGQADLRVHGGPEKAVYVYPSENYPSWEQDGYDLHTGRVGENVSSQGMTEADVRIGDVWRWGEALVQISQPRAPCFKFGMHTGRKDAINTMLRSGRSGWYLRVLETGDVPTTGTMELVERDAAAPEIATLFAASFPPPGNGFDVAALRQMMATPTLAEPWRQTIASKLARLDASS
jgi:MOSC domain-containing protein YiiM